MARSTRIGLGVLGVGTASVIAHNATNVMRLRKRAKALRIPLDHDGVVGDGLGEAIDLWVLGDSASDGYGLHDPADAFPSHIAHRLAQQTNKRVKLTSLGEDGARLANVTEMQVPKLAPSAEAVAVLAGANDVFGRRSAAQVTADATVMIDAIKAASPGAMLVIAGCPDFGKAHGFPQPLRRILGWRSRVTAKAIGEACASAGVPFIDIVPDSRPDLFGEDGVHPNRAASVAMAGPVIDAMLAAANAVNQGVA